MGKGVGIVQRQNGSWRVQNRKKGFPYQTRDFLSHAEADEWAIAQLSTTPISVAFVTTPALGVYHADGTGNRRSNLPVLPT